jgi:S1-C subfamily serine protease
MKAGHVILVGLGLFGTVFAASLLAFNLVDKTRSTPPALVLNNNATPSIQVQNSAKGLPDFRAASKQILPSIVSITTLMEGENWFGERYVEPSGTGSGVVISKNGHIVTNNHVVTSGGKRVADKIIVKFSSGDTAEAKVIGTDPRSDIAVLQVQSNNLTPIITGDSEALEVGQWVIAAGNPLGFEQTVSVGIVSNKGRPLKSEDYAIFIDGIQTDAAINKGNSGGALCDAEGRLIGINTMIASTDQGSVGIGFAIPVNRVQKVVDEIIKYGHARYGRIGIAVRSDSSILSIPQIRERLKAQVGAETNPPAQGVIISQVYEGPAAKAGLTSLDIITSINGIPMKATEDYQVFMADKKPGDQLKISYWSRGENKTVTVTLTDVETTE